MNRLKELITFASGEIPMSVGLEMWCKPKYVFISILFALVLVLSFSLVTAVPAVAATTYYVSTSGSDNVTGTEEEPWLTISYALTQVSAGDTILVAAGRYNENVEVDKQLTQLTLTGDVDRPSNVVVDAGGGGAAIEVGADNCVVQGFTVQNGEYGIYTDNTNGHTLSHNITNSNTEYGIYLDNSDNNTLENNTTNSNTKSGIYLDNSDNNTLEDNTANSNTNYGIYLDSSSNNTLTSNTANLNTNYGIYLDSSSNNTLTENTANLNTNYGIYLTQSGSNNLTGNAMSGNSYNFHVVGSSVSHYVQAIDTTNTVDGKPVYYLVGASVEVIGASTDAGYVGVVNSDNVTVKDLTLTKGGQGVLFAYTSDSSIENVTVSNNYYGIYLDTSGNNTLTSNCVTGNNIGVEIQGAVDASTISINFNSIHSNTECGVENSGSGTADAINNWWGDKSGPSHTSNPNGTGDAVSDNVNYDPWHLKQIGDLTASNPTESSIDLFWTTIGAWDGDYFDVRYSTSTITSGNWDSASRATGEPTPSTSTASQGMRVSGLSSDTTYYFGLKLIDEDIGSSDISNIASDTTLTTAPTDTTAPSAITDLAASAGTPSTTKVILIWTAKGDDDTAGIAGIASRYIIKRSTSEITAVNFDSATTVYNDLLPKANGDSESFTVSRLSPNTTYYFATKIQDEVPNTSLISNVVNIATANLQPTVTNISPTTGDNGVARTLTITGTNFTSSGTTVVRFVSSDNTFDLTNVTYVSATQLTAVMPIGASTDTYQARVINNNGTSELSSVTYTVTAAPTPLPVVTNLIPQMAASNTAVSGVQIFGENLSDATAVKFGDTAATSFTVISNTKIIADVPRLPAGEYDVKVTTTAGTNSISAVRFKVCAPVVINTDNTEDITCCEVIDMGDTNVTPVQITMTTDTSETATQATDTDAEIEVVIPPQTMITDSEGNDYTENITSPRVVKPDESILTDLAEGAVVIEMGNPEETIHFDQDCVARLVLTSSTQPLIWYFNKDSQRYELAGTTGTKDGIDYVPGGTKLGQEDNIYTMGLLLNHMSPYISGVNPRITSAPASATPGENITITGANFDPVGAEVYFDATISSIISKSLTEIVVTTPAFSGNYTVTLKVENSDKLSDTRQFTLLVVFGGEPWSPPLPELPPGVRDVSSLVTVNGVFTHRITIQSADRIAQLTLPKGTQGLTENRFPLSEISIIPMEEPPYDPPEGAVIIGQVYDIGPDGTTFDPPIFLTFTYDESQIPEGAAEADLVPVRGDEKTGEWVALEFWIVDPETNTITGLVRRFTPFTILAYIRPAAFATSDMLIIPTEVDIGETVNIITVVSNTSGKSGSYEVTLKINGVAEASSKVTIAAGDSALVSFSTTKDTAGTYLLEVNGLTGSFTVKESPVAPSPEVKPPINWPVLGGIIAGVVIVVGLLISVVRREKI